MKKCYVLFSLLMSTVVFTACGTGIKNSSGSSNSDSDSSVSMQTQNIEMEITDLVNLGSDPQAYMLYGSYRNEEEYKDEDGSYAEKHADDYDYMTLQLADSEEYEVQILPVELQADTDFLNSDLAGKTDEELKDEVGLTDQQIAHCMSIGNIIICVLTLSKEKNTVKMENILIPQIISSSLPMKWLVTNSIWDWKL